MPWSNQGGGPWGSGPKGPWGSGPQPSGGSTPPDLEDLLRRSQDKLKTVLPGGNLGGRGALLAVVLALVLWGISGFFVVQPEELGVVQQFGKYVRDVPAGWGYHWPYPIESVTKANIERINQHRCRHAADRGFATRRGDARRARREPDADRRRKYRRRRFRRALEDQAGRSRQVSFSTSRIRKAQ